MNIDDQSPDLLEDINIPIPEQPPLPGTNHSSVSITLGSITVRGADSLEDSDVIENGISQDMLEDSAPLDGVMICMTVPQHGGSDTNLAVCSKNHLQYMHAQYVLIARTSSPNILS